MADAAPSKSTLHRVTKHPPFERIALLLQGGGALGSYQAGAYQALAEANLETRPSTSPKAIDIRPDCLLGQWSRYG